VSLGKARNGIAGTL